MKNPKMILMLFCSLFILPIKSYCQVENPDEIILFYELAGPGNFYEGNNRHQPSMDTIFQTPTGFRLYHDHSTIIIDKEEWLVFKYPKYQKGVSVDKKTAKEGDAIKIAEDNAPVYESILNKNDKILMIRKKDFESIKKYEYHSVSFCSRKSYQLSTGIMSIPFKLRPAIDSVDFNLTTDITLGAYFGITKRISPIRDIYLTIPATLGLSFININNNNTTNEKPDDDPSITPGITWSSGLVLQFGNFSSGFVFGQDFASSVGDDWRYNGEFWYSFALGYNFLQKKEDKK